MIRELEKIANKKITLLEVDICDFNSLQQSLQNFPITSVIHFAAKKAVGESVQSPILYYENNVGGTQDKLLGGTVHVLFVHFY